LQNTTVLALWRGVGDDSLQVVTIWHKVWQHHNNVTNLFASVIVVDNQEMVVAVVLSQES
jgi:hypothetical protein